jgi:hypothetical protein
MVLWNLPIKSLNECRCHKGIADYIVDDYTDSVKTVMYRRLTRICLQSLSACNVMTDLGDLCEPVHAMEYVT